VLGISSLALWHEDEPMKNLLEVCRLTVELPTPAGWVRPVNDVSLQIDAGESLGLVGESGSGKTMLALALMGLLPPGCAFEPRCALRRAECAQRVPDLRVANPDHSARCVLID
jgi:ABC-type dipeptide/oligopeptide/nickel transport system ATPase component